jgi:hypothetical protein
MVVLHMVLVGLVVHLLHLMMALTVARQHPLCLAQQLVLLPEALLVVLLTSGQGLLQVRYTLTY